MQVLIAFGSPIPPAIEAALGGQGNIASARMLHDRLCVELSDAAATDEARIASLSLGIAKPSANIWHIILAPAAAHV